MGKDGKEGEVQGDEMEIREKKRGRLTAPGMTVLVWALWRGNTVCGMCGLGEGGESRVT